MARRIGDGRGDGADAGPVGFRPLPRQPRLDRGYRRLDVGGRALREQRVRRWFAACLADGAGMRGDAQAGDPAAVVGRQLHGHRAAAAWRPGATGQRQAVVQSDNSASSAASPRISGVYNVVAMIIPGGPGDGGAHGAGAGLDTASGEVSHRRYLRQQQWLTPPRRTRAAARLSPPPACRCRR